MEDDQLPKRDPGGPSTASRYIWGIVFGSLTTALLAVVLTTVPSVGVMGHGGTGTDWNHDLAVAAGMGALIGATFGVLIAHATRPDANESKTSASIEHDASKD